MKKANCPLLMDLPVWIPINNEFEDEKIISPLIAYNGINYTMGYSSSFSQEFVFVIPEKIRVKFRPCIKRSISDPTETTNSEYILNSSGSEIDYAYLMSRYQYACDIGGQWYVSKCFWEKSNDIILIDKSLAILQDLLSNESPDDAIKVVRRISELGKTFKVVLFIQNQSLKLCVDVLKQINSIGNLKSHSEPFSSTELTEKKYLEETEQLNKNLQEIKLNSDVNLIVMNFWPKDIKINGFLETFGGTHKRQVVVAPEQKPDETLFFCNEFNQNAQEILTRIIETTSQNDKIVQENKQNMKTLENLEKQLLNSFSEENLSSSKLKKERKHKKHKIEQKIPDQDQNNVVIQTKQELDTNLHQQKTPGDVNTTAYVPKFNNITSQIEDDEIQAIATSSERIIDLLDKGHSLESGIKNYYILKNSQLNTQHSHYRFNEVSDIQNSAYVQPYNEPVDYQPLVIPVCTNIQSTVFSDLQMRHLSLQAEQQQFYEQINGPQKQFNDIEQHQSTIKQTGNATVKAITNDKYSHIFAFKIQPQPQEELPELEIDIEEVDDEMTFKQRSIIADLLSASQQQEEQKRKAQTEQLKQTINTRESNKIKQDNAQKQLKAHQDNQLVTIDISENQIQQTDATEEIPADFHSEEFKDLSVNSEMIMSKPITLRRYQNSNKQQDNTLQSSITSRKSQTLQSSHGTRSVTQESIQQKMHSDNQLSSRIKPVVVQPIDNEYVQEAINPFQQYYEQDNQFYKQQDEIQSTLPQRRLHVNELYKYRNMKVKNNQNTSNKQKTNWGTYQALEQQGKHLQRINDQLDQIIEKQVQTLNRRDQSLQNDINERLQLVNKLLEPHLNKQKNIQ